MARGQMYWHVYGTFIRGYSRNQRHHKQGHSRHKNYQGGEVMKEYIVWEIWNTDGKYLGYYPENEYYLAVSYAESFNGHAYVVKSKRVIEV